ncbi:uncharacterized protein K02A2.6-like [Liolophura sinensis]|uniref:uncharacterized protein K02A2.6-like n=1 Tax=Liolophura sinensis TaxID=3198878 RepID=UPI0031596AAF
MRKPLALAPPRIQRMMLSLQLYDLNVVFRPGKEIPIADTLSRNYKSGHDAHEDPTLEEHVHAVLERIPVTDQKLEKIKSEKQKIQTLIKLKSVIHRGWPQTKRQVDADLKEFWHVRDELTVLNGILFKSDKIVIPASLHVDMLQRIHAGHFGMELCKRRAREFLYWPHMCSQIEDYVNRCSTCLEHSSSLLLEPMMSPPIPNGPWKLLATDLFEWHKRNYLIVADYYSHYFEDQPVT